MNVMLWLLIAVVQVALGCGEARDAEDGGGSAGNGSGGSSGSGGASVVGGSVRDVDSSVLANACSRVAGEFSAWYTPVQTNCDPLATVYKVPFDSGKLGVQETNVNLGDVRIKTEIVATGCAISMTQSIIKKTADNEWIEQKISGNSLTIEAADRITGIVEIIRYDENQQVTCSGKYDATFTQAKTFTGGAGL